MSACRAVSGSEAGERPWNRSSQSHSAPKICASVSRTEEKLDPIGLVNCSGVSPAAASSERRLAHALYSYSRRISSGDIALPHKLDFVLRDSTNRNLNRFVFLRRRTRVIGLAVRREAPIAHIFAISAHRVGNHFADVRILPRKLRCLVERKTQKVVHYQDLPVAVRT